MRPQRRAALARAATVGGRRLRRLTQHASTKGCSRESSDRRVNNCTPSAGPPQRRAALARAATDAEQPREGVAVHASTKGCSRESSDVYQWGDEDEGHPASTKGCSRESSDAGPCRGECHASTTSLNEGLLSREQRPTLTRECGVAVRPQRRAALARAATRQGPHRDRQSIRRLNEGLLSREQRHRRDQRPAARRQASTKGCSRESSDPWLSRRP